MTDSEKRFWWSATIYPYDMCYKAIGIKQMLMIFKKLDEIYELELSQSNNNIHNIRNAIRTRLVGKAIILRTNNLLIRNDKRHVKICT